MKNFSDFWIDSRTKKDISRKESIDVPTLVSIKRSIAQFVHILTGKRIPVKYKSKGGQSYTDGNVVVISSDVTEETFDETVGLALHEGSHILKTNFHIFKNVENYVPNPLKDKSEKKFGESEFLSDLLHKIMNYVEDRRIDNWVFSTSPGYKGYYHSMYDAYWHSDEISEQLKSDEFREENMQSYMFRIINLTNPNTDLNALDGLKKIHDIIGLDNIDRLKTTHDVLEISRDILDVLIDQVEDIEFDESGDIRFVPGELDGDEEGETETIDVSELSEEEKEDLRKAIQDQMDFLDDEIDKKVLSSDIQGEVEATEDAGVDVEEVGEGSGNPHKVDCVVVERLTEKLINKSKFPIIKEYEQEDSVNAVKKGQILGRMLGRKLKVRDEKRNTKYPHRKNGTLDQARLCEVEYNNRLFYEEVVEEYDDAFVHITVDASGSMRGNKWFEAMSTCVAIAKACSMIDNVRVQISFRSTTNSGFGHSKSKPLVLIAYDSEKNSFNHIVKYFPNIVSSGTTPEGLSFEAIQDKILIMSNDQDGYFVNLSDGQPNFNASDFSYRGKNALEHTRRQVQKIRRKNIKVLSYYIGSSQHSNSAFDTMYGKDAKYIEVSDINQISNTMNQKFLEK